MTVAWATAWADVSEKSVGQRMWLVVISPAPDAFDHAPPLFRDQPLTPLCRIDFRRLPFFRRRARPFQERQEAAMRAVAVDRLRSVRAADDDEYAICGDVLSAQCNQAFLHVGRKRRL